VIHSNIEFTPIENQVLAVYRDPKRSGISRAIRVSIQYAIGAACFVAIAILTGNALWSLAVYGVLIAFMVNRLLGARAIAGVMPGVIAKYERRITELEAAASASESSSFSEE